MTRFGQSRVAVSRLLFWIMLAFALAKALVLPPKAFRLFHWDKAEHFAAFYVLTVLALAAFPRRPLAWIVVTLSALGAGIEVVQALPIVARDSDAWDWMADTLAIGAAVLPLYALQSRLRAAGKLRGGRPGTTRSAPAPVPGACGASGGPAIR